MNFQINAPKNLEKIYENLIRTLLKFNVITKEKETEKEKLFKKLIAPISFPLLPQMLLQPCIFYICRP
jgi:hypothetical protein